MSFRGSVVAAALIAVLAIPTVGQAQTIKVGVRAGAHLASLRGSTGALLLPQSDGSISSSQGNWGPRAGVQAGVVLHVEVTEWVAIQPEVDYVQKGGTATASLVRGVRLHQTTRYSYLELPVLAKVSIPTGGPLEPSLLVGPSFGLNLRAENEAVVQTPFGTGGGRSRRETVPAAGTEWGIVLGGEVGYTVSSGNALFLGVRYARGLTDVGPADAGPRDAEGSVHSEVVSLEVGYVVAL